jgi:hypothetical protein
MDCTILYPSRTDSVVNFEVENRFQSFRKGRYISISVVRAHNLGARPNPGLEETYRKRKCWMAGLIEETGVPDHC